MRSPATLPLWAVALCCLVITTAGFGALLRLAAPEVSTAADLSGGLVVGLVAAALVAAGLADRRFRHGWSRTERIAMARAYRSGEAPADPVLDQAVLAMITRKRRVLRWQARYGPWSIALLGVADLTSVISDRVGTGLPGFVFFAAAIAHTRIAPPRSLRRLDRLEIAIGERRSHPAVVPFVSGG
ncbi:hypothetical protein FB559_4298 [Actinoallomurus bryophytorum]|uniref:Uncharacterized protein n=1 Tax=Actinoallomurus bryophytorum TaxID=1490222 RepID=A0A543CNX6_9ACTN|nr:hypothetical protein FB559_4298 [Actinoallomurus bryophytorum]